MGRRHFIIGNPSSIWMKEYIKQIHLKSGNEISITVFDWSELLYEDEYAKLGVELVKIGDNSSGAEKIKKVINLLRFAFKHRKKNKFDIVEIQVPPNNFQATVISWMIRLMKTETVVGFWGSDILDINPQKAKNLEKIVKESDTLLLSTDAMREVFRSYYGTKYDHKFDGAKFGSLAYEEIKGLLQDNKKKDCKKKLGVNTEKTTVAVGYNGKSSQQHLPVLEQLKDLDNEFKDGILLLIHMGYGTDSAYAKQVEDAASETGIEYWINYDLMNLEEVAVLRGATDIFIHAQVSDALSGTIRECIYAGTVLINPSWIKYDEYDEMCVQYIKYNKFNELNSILMGLLTNETKIDIEGNSNKVYNAYSWDAVRPDWMRIFNEGTN